MTAGAAKWYNQHMYYVYLLYCDGGGVYAGVTGDLCHRLRQHRGQLAGGAKYTRAHRALTIAAAWHAADRAAAQRLEYRLKKLSHAEKMRLCAGEPLLEPCGDYARCDKDELAAANGGNDDSPKSR